MVDKRPSCGRTDRSRKRKKELTSISCNQNTELVNLKKWMKENWHSHNLHFCQVSSDNSQSKSHKSQTQDKNLSHLRSVCFPTTGRGLMALKQLAAGDVIVEIPRGLMVSCSDVSKDGVLKVALERAALKLTSCELLTLFLLYYKTVKHSKWQPYIESLPKEFHIASSKEVSLYPSFICSYLTRHLSTLESACGNIQSVFDQIQESCGEITTQDIEWAYMAVNSRTVYLKPQEHCQFLQCDDDGSCALAPFLDLLNHSFEASVSVKLNEHNMYQIVTHVPYKKYDQVFINYGPHDNMKLFVEYGFFIPNNPHDGIPISIEKVLTVVAGTTLPKSVTASHDTKKKIVSTLGETRNMFVARDGPSWSLEIVVTILLLPEDQVRSWQAVYGGGCLEPCTREGVRMVLVSLMKGVLLSLEENLERMRTAENKSEHLKIGCSLVEEYVNLVRHCLNTYLE